MPRFERTLVIQAPVDRVYQWWADFHHWPTVLPRLQAVEPQGTSQLRLIATGDDGQPIAWDAHLTQNMPQRLLAWESRGGPFPSRLRITFESLSQERTRMHVCAEEHAERPYGTTAPPVLLDQWDVALERFRERIEDHQPAPPLPIASPYRDIFYKAMSASAGAVIVFGLAWGFVSLTEVWMILLGALLVAATLSPAVSWLERKGTARSVAVALPFLALLLFFGVVAFILVPGIISQGQELANRIPGYTGQLQGLVASLHARHRFFPADTQVMAYLAGQASAMLGNAFSLTTRFLWVLIVLLSILFLSLFLLLDGQRLLSTTLRMVPISQKRQLPALMHTVQTRVGRYMLGLAFICILAGVLTWGALSLMGVPYALLIGTVTTLLQAVPFVGPLFGGGLAAAIALGQSPDKAVWTLVVYTVIQQVIGQFLFPLIMGRTLGIHPVWIALALLIGGTLYGLVGAFVAIPIAIAFSIVLECYYVPWAEARAAQDEDVPAGFETRS